MEALEKIVQPERVNASRIERYLHSHDLAPVPGLIRMNYDNMPSAVVKPKTADEIAQIVKAAPGLGTCLVPKGRGTSYLWGSVPVKGGIVVDMVEMSGIAAFSGEDGTVTAHAGTTWEQVEDYLAPRGYALRVYPTSMPSATLGGWVASAGTGLGAGGYGVGSMMYGPVGENIAGLEVVTGAGEIKQLQDKSDIADFVGTDGITGFVTKVKLKIRTHAPFARRLILHLPDEKAIHTMIEMLRLKNTAYHAQFEDAGLLDCKRVAGLHAPEIDTGFLLFVALEGEKGAVLLESGELVALAKKLVGTLRPVEEAETEWKERCYPMRLKRGGPTVIAGEFTVPDAGLASALREADELLPGDPAKSGIHGVMAGNGNVIVMPQVLSDERRGFGFLAALSYSKIFNDIAPRHGGRPYGVGHLNAFNAKLVHGRHGFERLKALKKKYDPHNVVNPGKGIEHGTKFGIAVPSFMFALSMFALGLFRKAGV